MSRPCFFSDATTKDGSQPQSFQTAMQNALITQLHFHNYERWLGAQAGQIGPGSQNSLIGYRVTSSATANTFGSSIVVFDGTETPVTPGKSYFDLHRIVIINVQNADKIWRIRLANNSRGDASYAAAVANNQYSDVVIFQTVSASNKPIALPTPVLSQRFPAGTIVWAAVATADSAAQYIDFILGLHEYTK